MFTVIIPTTTLSNIVLNNTRLFCENNLVKEILIVNISDKFLELQNNIKKVRILQLYNMDFYLSLSEAIEAHSSYDHIVLLDDNIQINYRFMNKLSMLYTNNHLYTFKVNTILDNKSIIDKRVGNKVTPDTFNICAMAFCKKDAINVNCFRDTDLVGFANNMQDNGVNLKLLHQVVCHIPTNYMNHKILDYEPKQEKVVFEPIKIPEYNINTTYSIIIPFSYTSERYSLLKISINNLYEHIKQYDNILIYIHETSTKRELDESFIKKYNIKYKFTYHKGVFDIAWNYNYLCKHFVKSDILVFFDADLMIDNLWLQSLFDIDKTKVYVGWGMIKYLSRTGMDQYKKGRSIDICKCKNGYTTSFKDNVIMGDGASTGGINIIPRNVFFSIRGWPEDFSGLGYGCVDTSMMYKLKKTQKEIYNFQGVAVYHLYHKHRTQSSTKRFDIKYKHKSYTKNDWNDYIENIDTWGDSLPKSKRHLYVKN